MERQFTNLIREAKTKKGIVLYGNTREEFVNNEKYVLLPQYVSEILKENGFTVVGTWDRFQGLSFETPREKEIFSGWYRDESCESAEEEGETYDLGNHGSQKSDDLDLTAFREFDQYISALSGVMESANRPCAFILDWSDFQFGTVQTPLAPEDRMSLELLAKLMTGRHGTGAPNKILSRSPAVVILITASLASIPPVFYRPESRVKLYSLAPPEKNTRVRFFEAHLEDFNIKQNSERTRAEIIDLLADMSDGMKTVDLIQMVKLAREERGLTPEKLFNLYRFGERKSPWEDLSDSKLQNVEPELKKRVIGQDSAVHHVATTIIKAAVGLSGIQHSAKMCKPKGVLFFVGPTGVGKTELAKTTAEFLFGDENACIRFDMSEYSHEESDQRLIGAPPGYVGFEEGGQLINAVIERPFCVLLFDEIEKAHPRILDKFLQILEDGRLTDGKGVTAYFSEAVIIFTSNIGSSDVDERNKNSEEIENEYLSKVKSHFNNVLKRPELLNRIGDNIIVFQSVNDPQLRTKIIKRKLVPLKELIKNKYGVSLIISDELYSFFEKRADSSHGGRGLLNAVERDLINPLSFYIFTNKQFLNDGREIIVYYNDESKKVDFDIRETK